MDIKEKSKVNKAIGEILNRYIGSLNSIKNRRQIAYELKTYLEDENIDFEGVNVYTPQERADKGFIDIKVDNELYPFSEINELNKDNWHDYTFKWESGELNDGDVIKLFQYLIDEGYVWTLQKRYSRLAEDLIENGYCTLSCKQTKGYCVWGSITIPAKSELPKNAPGTDEFVQKRKELNNDEFTKWADSKKKYK